MFCGKCGNELSDGAKFCGKCGAIVNSELHTTHIAEKAKNVLPNSLNTASKQQQQESAYLDETSYSNVFVEPDEQLLGTLGNGWITNLFFHKLKKCNALLTNKRLYLQGTFFTGSRKSLTRNKYEKVIDLDDITASGFLYSDIPAIIAMLLTPIVSAIVFGYLPSFIGYRWFYFFRWNNCFMGLLIGAVIDIIRYIMNRKVYFLIEYAGGGIRFDASIIGIADVKDFHKQIRRAKNNAKGKA